MLLEAVHITRHYYEEPVSQCLNEVRLTPRALDGQKVIESRLEVEPEAAFVHRRKDYFGNEVATLGVLEKHDRLVIASASLVELEPGGPVHAVLAWEEARAALAEAAEASALSASEFLWDSPFIEAGPALAEFAGASFTPGRPLLEAVADLSHRIHQEFRYEPKSTSIDIPLGTVLRNRRGVCQDFAHIMIGALRSQGLAARYVSGYLRSGTKCVGAEASHAWVSVFVPGSGWVGFDPTNDTIPLGGHVTVAWGRDYGDVTPVKGITLGGGGQMVEVEVRVRPAV